MAALVLGAALALIVLFQHRARVGVFRISGISAAALVIGMLISAWYIPSGAVRAWLDFDRTRFAFRGVPEKVLQLDGAI